MLQNTGCDLPAYQRPYNGISLLFDRIEAHLPPREFEAFYAHEHVLRSLYQSFIQRYAGVSMYGCWLHAACGDVTFCSGSIAPDPL